ncbi:MAG TPA: DUF1579 family protein [Phycisphaerae bacterium]|nr:DUF1579 family protein [Phycisphaerae bacterium]
MMRSRIVVVPAVIACSAALVTMAQPQGLKQSQSELKKRYAEMVERTSGPTDQHKSLKAFVGKFDQVSEVRMGSGDPMLTHSIAKGRWIMGERFVKVDCESAPDEELKGSRMLIYGYDPQAKRFTLLNLESMSLTALTLLGDYDAESKTFTFEGERGQTGGEKVPVRWVIKVRDDGALDQQILMKPPGTEDFTQVVKIKYTPRSK